ncbi:hypothetical protein [Lentibacillus sp. CBA3610]|uniref:hypothetical protein n=1 Tax=Lentibacillus sp. CBA3610 TaxID=2518176 RepID=UPI00159526CE|nr:hypothetical protein [Lentibacillus sp. CBA3610]QKY70307.1 hypothetical protein Len3610_12520 [Lentibacillus sp. CBA3610]
MQKVFEQGDISFYEYTPTIFKPFYVNLEPLTLKRRLRLLMAYFSGFKVFYLKYQGEYAGYCLVQSGRDNRYKFASKKDIMVGPYFICEGYRGKKLSVTLLEFILKRSNLEFANAYDYIQKDNIPSIKASEAVGFKYFSDANLSRYVRSIILCDSGQGDFVIYKYTKR